MTETTELIVNLEHIHISLPETMIVVNKEKYHELKEQADLGRYMTLSEVLNLLSVSRPWLLENVLYKPAIRKKIDIEQNPNGFVKYPENQGGRYFFLVSKTKVFFEKNFTEIFKEK